MRRAIAVLAVVVAFALAGCASTAPAPTKVASGCDGCASSTPAPTTAAWGCGGGNGGQSLGGDVPSAACSHGPMTTPSPPAISEAEAIATAERFLGTTGLASAGLTGDGTPIYLLEGAGSAVLVDGTTGELLEYFALAPAIGNPDGAVPSWPPSPAPATTIPVASADAAIEAARAWLSAHGIATTKEAGRATFDTIPGSDAWNVTLGRADGRQVSVRVRTRGAVAGYLAPTTLPLRLPRVDRDEAIELALDLARHATGNGDQQLINAEFMTAVQTDGQVAEWMIGTGVPAVDPTDGTTVWSKSFVFSIDPMTGQKLIVKQG